MKNWISFTITFICFITLLNSLSYVLDFLNSVCAGTIPSDFIGSEKCKTCHEKEYKNWKETLHSKMMQSVEIGKPVQGDFEKANDYRPFKLKEVTWTLGNKWEQQYLTRFNDRDIILPGKWLIAQKKWKLYRFDGWGWENADPKYKCHGCHTIGYDPETGKWNELSIGCEACHGPGKKHIMTKSPEDIINTISADICGQCHARGGDVTGYYDFPITYRLGNDLEKHFKFSIPAGDINSRRFWWGNGLEKKRHQEYLGWRNSVHAKRFKSAKTAKKIISNINRKSKFGRMAMQFNKKYGRFSQKCLKCHSGEHFLASIKGKSTDHSSLRYSITCAVCHDICGGDGDKDRSFLRTIKAAQLICQECHPKGAYYHRSKNKKMPHYPCNVKEITCVDCHMPLVGKNAGTYSIRSHSLRIVSPQDSIKYNMPNSCNSGMCHQNNSLDWLVKRYNNWYGNQSQ